MLQVGTSVKIYRGCPVKGDGIHQDEYYTDVDGILRWEIKHLIGKTDTIEKATYCEYSNGMHTQYMYRLKDNSYVWDEKAFQPNIHADDNSYKVVTSNPF